ncbi:hypothetical protein IJG44_01275, partial [bacterium]|nr:hypothetical protein [bacterium]
MILVSFLVIAEETNWISYDGWVTGPGANENNKYTYLLPYGYCADEDCSPTYIDEYPLLYETDMGWPVPNADETELKYLFFGDTYFFMRDENHCVTSKVTGPRGTILLNFDINEDLELCTNHEAAEIERKYDFFPSSGTNLKAMCLNHCPIADPNYTPEQCAADCADISANCSDCINFCINPANSYVWSYFGVNNLLQCWNFCVFDTVNTYASLGYFLYDGNDSPEDLSGQAYNNGTSNIFLAAELDDTLGTGNETQYNINFLNAQPESSNLNSPQVHSATDNRRSNSIWMNAYERDFKSSVFVGIYPRGYFYACAGSPSDGCTSKKLFVPYSVTSWDFLTPATFCQNAFNRPHIVIPGSEVTELTFEAGDELKNELERQKQSLGIGIYDFEDECRVKFSQDSEIFPYSFPGCDTTGVDNECYHDPVYPNRNILWPNLSRMSNMTVIHDISKDILSIDNNEEYPAGYIYFMGTGETEVHTDDFSLTCKTYENPSITYYNGANQNTITKTTQKAYIARVPAYESEIKCASSYEYFAGITNGIARWEKDMSKAEPLYGFYPLQFMEAESIVKHRDLYWMTARLNEPSQKGFVVLASPDAFHWQKVDTILLDKPEAIWRNYAFFWLPPKLIQEGDNTMPFLYSIWKNHTDPISGKYTLSGFLDDSLNPKFTRYNLKMGQYKFMEENVTRAFLADNAEYGNLLKNNIPNNFSNSMFGNNISNSNNGTIPLPFVTYQNLDNLDNTDLTSNELDNKREELKNRYVIIEYCYCGNQLEEEDCKNFVSGNCSPYREFVTTESGNGGKNWKIIDIVEDEFFKAHVENCEGRQNGDPDYMCNIPFEHGETLPQGHRNIPVWNWREQISKNLGTTNRIGSANVILRFSHWHNKKYIWYNFPEINQQLIENNKLIPYDCPDPNGNNNNANLIYQTCQSPDSWKTTNLIHLTFRLPNEGDFLIKYLYPYPVMIHDFGKPGDPAPWVWDMLVADHFAKEFFKVSSFEYADSSLRTLTSGAAATAVIKNGQMQIYAWGGTASIVPRSTSPAGILYVGTYNPETEVVTFMSEILDETDTNSPALTAGASMVYDDENDKIYLIGAVDQNGISRIYRLEDARTGRKWESVATIDLGRYFRLVKKSEHEYFAFGGQTGGTSFNTKLYLLDLNNVASPQLLANIPTSGLANSFAAYSEMDQKLYVFGGLDENGASDRFLSYDIKTNVWSNINVSGGPGEGYGGVILVDYITETMSLGGGVFVNNEDRQFQWIFNPKDMTWTKELKSGSYCLKESETTLQGGIGTSGTCVPFTHPWYNSFSAGATVYSLDGKGKRLYVGTNNAIKVYDISDPIAPVLVSSFSTSSRVNDLEVYGDTL